MPMTLTQVQTSLANWITAYDRVSSGETYSMGGRTLTLTDAQTCRDQITWLQNQETRLLLKAAGGGSGVSHALSNFESE